MLNARCVGTLCALRASAPGGPGVPPGKGTRPSRWQELPVTPLISSVYCGNLRVAMLLLRSGGRLDPLVRELAAMRQGGHVARGRWLRQRLAEGRWALQRVRRELAEAGLALSQSVGGSCGGLVLAAGRRGALLHRLGQLQEEVKRAEWDVGSWRWELGMLMALQGIEVEERWDEGT